MKEIFLSWGRGKIINRISQISSSNWFSAITQIVASVQRRERSGAVEAAHGKICSRKVMLNQARGGGRVCKAFLTQIAVRKITFCFSSPTLGHLGARPCRQTRRTELHPAKCGSVSPFALQQVPQLLLNTTPLNHPSALIRPYRILIHCHPILHMENGMKLQQSLQSKIKAPSATHPHGKTAHQGGPSRLKHTTKLPGTAGE